MQWTLNDKDYAYLRAWGISLAEDTRTPAESDARLVLPEWLRRAVWRQFWAEQDSCSASPERLFVFTTQAGFSSNRRSISDKPPSRPESLIQKVLAWFTEIKPHRRSEFRAITGCGTERKR